MTSTSSLLKDISCLLLAAKAQLVTAESCTGGLVAGLVTDIPGCSKWFERGFVVYSNLAKQELLSVSSQLLETYGAVSEQTASAMACGALLHSAGTVALAVTGIAGPDGGSAEKPVGTVCFAWVIRNRPPVSTTRHFEGKRADIRQAACEQALQGLLQLLQKR